MSVEMRTSPGTSEPPAGPTITCFTYTRPREVKSAVRPRTARGSPEAGRDSEALTLAPRSRGSASLTRADARAGARQRGYLWPERRRAG